MNATKTMYGQVKVNKIEDEIDWCPDTHSMPNPLALVMKCEICSRGIPAFVSSTPFRSCHAHSMYQYMLIR